MHSLSIGIRKNEFLPIGQKLSSKITSLLAETEIEDQARALGFVQRSSNKLTGRRFLDLLLFTHFNHKQLSLNEMAVQLKMRYDVEITKQALDNRFNQAAVTFIKNILEKALKMVINQEVSLDFLHPFKKVRIKDSTAFQLPGNLADSYPGSGGHGSKAMLRIQFEFDLKTGQVLDLSLHPFNYQDKTDATQTIDSVNEDELVIRDLGYIKLSTLKAISDTQAFFLNRLGMRLAVYEKQAGKYIRLDFNQMEQALRSRPADKACIEKQVYLGEEKLPARLIMEPVPEDKKQQRLRKIHKQAKKKGRNVGKEYKSRCGLNLFITNMDAAVLEKDHARELYSLRWQVELIFKVWKSIGEIHQIKKMKLERLECYLYGKLLWIIMNWHIFWQATLFYYRRERIIISMYKMFETLKEEVKSFRRAVMNGKEALDQFIVNIVWLSGSHHKLEKKKGKVSLTELIMKY